jgi:uncharacterized membrane protein
MDEQRSPRTPEAELGKIEVLVSHLLRAGVALSFVLIVCGTIVSFVRHPDYLHSREALQHLTAPGHGIPRDLGEILSGILELRGRAIVMAGLLVLVATPIARVAAMVVAFYYQGDRLFALISATVLCLLLLSFALGKVE